MTTRLDEHMVDAFRAAIGCHLEDLTTPALVLHADGLERNIASMAAGMRTRHAELRPHIKVHKCPAIARLQVAAGAIGVCTATVWEALVMARAGIGDILVANEVVGADKIEALISAASVAHLIVIVDDPANVAALATAAEGHGQSLDVLIDVDTGMGRCGVTRPGEAVELAREIERHASLHLKGVQGYEGHCMLEPEADRRAAMTHRANGFLAEVTEALTDAGYPPEIVSAGGTGTWSITSSHPAVTEVQAGSYVFMDAFHSAMVPGFEVCLTVLASVLSRHGSRLVIDAGGKSLVPNETESPIIGQTCAPVRYDEEHGIFHASDDCRLHIGDKVEVVPGYAPSTVSMYDVYHVVREGRVVDVWPVVPRGPGHYGLMAGR